jgi:MerR family gold-responsive transcriptional activator of gol and ges genes
MVGGFRLAAMNIGQLAKQSGVSVKMVRHYEAIGLIPRARRTASNYRVYRDDDLQFLRFVARARRLGFSITDIRELVGLWRNKSRSSAAVKRIAGRHVQGLRHKIAELESMAAALEHLATRCHGDHRPDCPILQDLSR